eukprot:4489920-Pleurochrysis_carterae.AAC.2
MHMPTPAQVRTYSTACASAHATNAPRVPARAHASPQARTGALARQPAPSFSWKEQTNVALDSQQYEGSAQAFETDRSIVSTRHPGVRSLWIRIRRGFVGEVVVKAVLPEQNGARINK